MAGGKTDGKAAGRETDSPLAQLIREEAEEAEAGAIGSAAHEAEKNDDFSQTAIWARRAAEGGYADGMRFLGLCYAKGLGIVADKTEAVAWYLKAAQHDDARAMYLLGECHANGDGLPKDQAQAVAWYRRAAELDECDAMCRLGSCYAGGNGVQGDSQLAASWYQQAADKGHAGAMMRLGLCFAGGAGLPKDSRAASYYFRKAADAMKKPVATSNEGRGGRNKDAGLATAWYLQAAEALDAEAVNVDALYAMGVELADRDGEGEDRFAVECFRKAAEHGHALAMFKLGVHYQVGWGVDQNDEQSLAWYQRAMDFAPAEVLKEAVNMSDACEDWGTEALAGIARIWLENPTIQLSMEVASRVWEAAGQKSPEKAFVLAECYEHGRDPRSTSSQAIECPQDACAGMKYQTRPAWEPCSEGAAYWLIEASKLGDGGVHSRLLKLAALGVSRAREYAERHAYGVRATIVPRSGEKRVPAADPESTLAVGKYYEHYDRKKKAAEWYRKAAGQGLAEAMFRLAVLSEEQDSGTETWLWYRQAAEAGHVEAMFRLGRMYEDGVGFPAEPGMAAEWYEKGAAAGHPRAQEALRRLRCGS